MMRMMVLALMLAGCAWGQTPVTVTETDAAWVMANAYVTATVSRTTGDMVSLKYKKLELMGYVSGHHAGYWEQNPSGAKRLEARMTIDPATNAGERAEVSVKGWSGTGKDAGDGLTAHPRSDPAAVLEDAGSQLNGRVAGPAAGSGRKAGAGTFTGREPSGVQKGPLLDMEIRYALGREDRGIYTYAVFTHETTYGATSLGESRYGFKLNSQVFDWLSVDAQRNGIMPTGADWDAGTDLNMKEARRLTTGALKGKAEHKYDYCADQFDTPAFGWSGTKTHVGLYFINASMEYLSSGPYHFELTGHLDDGDGGDPTLLDYWRGTHYGGSELPVKEGEDWTKVVGPIFVFVDAGATPDAMFAEAKEQAKKEAAKWPYGWVSGVDYPKAAERATVKGQMVLRDSEPGVKMGNVMVGLAYPDDAEDAHGLTWQNDAKHYEFWVRADAEGRFAMAKVRAGTYELHAVADGVLGEYSKADVTVGTGGVVDLGRLKWKPMRYGVQVFQIGVPNRSASEFLMGNDHWHWGEYVEYSKLFPNDVNYTVGKSDWSKEWFIYEVPHVVSDDGTAKSAGRATTWTVNFNMGREAPRGGKAVLRLGLAGVSTKAIEVGVNGKAAGEVTGLVYNATINRDGVTGSWVEKDVWFDAGMLKAGENTLTLTVPADGLTSGVAYDVVRLELAGK